MSADQGNTWTYWARIQTGIYSFFTFSRLLSRFLRIEVNQLYCTDTKEWFCIARKGIFRLEPETKIFRKVFSVQRGSRPMHLAVTPENQIFFGEYFSNQARETVAVYGSDNSGKNWEKVYEFPAHSIRHIHGIFYDPHENKLWICTGDENGECMIGWTRNNFKDLHTVFRGGQDVRCVRLLFMRDAIFYGTDTPLAKNYIYRIDRKTYEKKQIQELQGSVIHAMQNDCCMAVSTAVEPSEVNLTDRAYLWVSRNGNRWQELFEAEKDSFSKPLFQFGTFTFPVYAQGVQDIYAAARALKKFDGCSLHISLTAVSKKTGKAS